MGRYEYKPKKGPWPIPAYENDAFLGSSDGRPMRIMSEFFEPAARFRRFNIRNTIVFFGSARALPAENGAATPLSAYYDQAADLAEKLATWSSHISPPRKRFHICSGGGPGIMEAANRGAHRAGQRSLGLNINLPFEQEPNRYQSDELSFEFHYFFMRKFWFVYPAKALVIFPGGFGTIDEFFEILTLVQTQKTAKTMPIVVMGASYWKEVLNFDALVKWGTISEKDLDLFYMTDDTDEAFDHLKTNLTRLYL